MLKAEYPSDLSDLEWQLIKDILPPASNFGRPRFTDLKRIVNACFYVSRTGCPWRYLPRSFPPWKTVYDYFRKWRMSGLWQRIHDALVNCVREKAGRNKNPSLLMLDSQSAKAHYGDTRGYDGFKKVRGRKRQIVVDSLGLIHGLRVHAANGSDRTEGASVLERCRNKQAVTGFIVDSGYSGYKFESQVYRHLNIWPTITSSKAKLTCTYDPKEKLCEYKKVLTSSKRLMPNVTKKNIARFISREKNMSIAEVENILTLAFDMLGDEVLKGKKGIISGFGSFELKNGKRGKYVKFTLSRRIMSEKMKGLETTIEVGDLLKMVRKMNKG